MDITIDTNTDGDCTSPRQRLLAAKTAFTTRRVAPDAMAGLITDLGTQPQSGDLVLARVTHLGKHQSLQLVGGRRSQMFIGDEVIVCYGDRYAPDQFEAVVPKNLAPCHLVAGGGVAAQALCWHDSISGATRITPIGLVADKDGKRLNLRDWTLETAAVSAARPFTVAVAGTAMNAGKTATAAYLIKGGIKAGLKVAAAKLTGTGAGGDYWLMIDAGAHPVLDFTDAGFSSTSLISGEQIITIMETLMGHLRAAAVDVVVLEIADGLIQPETAALLASPQFAANVDGMIFAAGDALGAMAGVDWLRARNLPVLGVSGTISRSPLAARETQHATSLPVMGLPQLQDPAFISELARQPALAGAREPAAA
ncbi:MAG: DUF1611 domain-containing protein [Gammaproteobacteria bacterium]|nr:DUF1611 domain-containing protein [Gammaproteobacteria bacterium]